MSATRNSAGLCAAGVGEQGTLWGQRPDVALLLLSLSITPMADNGFDILT